MMPGKTRWLVVGVLCVALWTAAASAQQTRWEKLTDAGVKAYQEGRYAEAEKLLSDALKEAEKLGPNDPRLAASLNNLAAIYDAQGKYAEAEPLYKRSLAIREKALGPDHPDVATTLENYADLMRKTGREAEAEKMKVRATAIREQHAKPNPPK